MPGLSPHPAAELLPMMAAEPFAELVADIREHGQVEPILVDDAGQIVDGRNRYKACLEIGIEPITATTDVPSEKLIDLVVSLNVKRRHLNSSQRACIGVTLLPMIEAKAKERELQRKKGETPEDSPESKPKGESREEAARIVQSNSSYISKAKRLKKNDPKLFDQVKAGDLSLLDAESKLRQKKDAAYWDKYNADQKKKNEAERKNRPDPEEANRQAREAGSSVWASDGQWYDGLTDKEREAQDAKRDRYYKLGSEARSAIAFLGAYQEPDPGIPREEILQAILEEKERNSWCFRQGQIEYPPKVEPLIAFLQELRDADWPELPPEEPAGDDSEAQEPEPAEVATAPETQDQAAARFADGVAGTPKSDELPDDQGEADGGS